MLTTNKTKITIVEDDRAIAHMYRFKLESEGYLVSLAYDGEEGLSVIESIKPELILLDLKMPVMSGDIMLEKLRAKPWGIQIKVIILTNISKDEASVGLRLLNVDRYIVKAHHTPKQVLEIIEEILK